MGLQHSDFVPVNVTENIDRKYLVGRFRPVNGIQPNTVCIW